MGKDKVRIFIALDGNFSPNTQLFLLKLLNKVRCDNPMKKIVVVSDSKTIQDFVCQQTGFVVSDFLEPPFERAYIVTDKEDEQVDADAEGNPKYEFPVMTIRLRDGYVLPGPTLQVRPSSLPCPEDKPRPMTWAEHYTDFDMVARDDKRYIPLTLTPDLPMPRNWVTDVEGM